METSFTIKTQFNKDPRRIQSQKKLEKSYSIGDIIKTKKWTARVIMSAGEVIALSYMDGTFFTIMTPVQIKRILEKESIPFWNKLFK